MAKSKVVAVRSARGKRRVVPSELARPFLQDPRFAGETKHSLVFIPDMTGTPPHNLLDIPEHGLLWLDTDEQHYEDSPLYMTREEALERAAKWNAKQGAPDYYWHVVIEIGTPPKGFVSVNLSGDTCMGTLDIFDIPFRVVLPTGAERARFGKRNAKGGAA